MFCFHSHIVNTFEHNYYHQLDNIKNGNVTYYKQQIEQYLREYSISTSAKQPWKYFNTVDCRWKKSSAFIIYSVSRTCKYRNICHNNKKNKYCQQTNTDHLDNMIEPIKAVVAKLVQRPSKLHNKQSNSIINMYSLHGCVAGVDMPYSLKYCSICVYNMLLQLPFLMISIVMIIIMFKSVDNMTMKTKHIKLLQRYINNQTIPILYLNIQNIY